MKQKAIKKHFLIQKYNQLFSTEPNITRLSNDPNTSQNNNQIHPLATSYSRPSSAVLSLGKSLKSMTLSSKIYGRYKNFYSNLTQTHTFKSPRIKNYPILKNKENLSIQNQNLLEKSSINNKISFSTETSNSVFLRHMKEKKEK